MWAEIKETFKKSAKTDTRSLRNFGYLFTGILAVVAIWAMLRGSGSWLGFLIAGGVALLLSLTVPGALKPVYIPWMWLAAVLSYVMTRVLLALMFFTVFTVFSLVTAVLRRDPLELKLGASGSYWAPRKQRPLNKQFFQKQF